MLFGVLPVSLIWCSFSSPVCSQSGLTPLGKWTATFCLTSKLLLGILVSRFIMRRWKGFVAFSWLLFYHLHRGVRKYRFEQRYKSSLTPALQIKFWFIKQLLGRAVHTWQVASLSPGHTLTHTLFISRDHLESSTTAVVTIILTGVNVQSTGKKIVILVARITF